MADRDVPPEELERRRRWFEWYTGQLERNSIHRPSGGAQRYACPCCRYLTLPSRGDFDLCPVCFWEDDGQDDHDADVVRGGPNGALSLVQARANFQACGACDERHRAVVRAATPEERE